MFSTLQTGSNNHRFLADSPAKNLHLTLFRRGAVDTACDKETGNSFYVKMGLGDEVYEMSVSSRTNSSGIFLTRSSEKCIVPKFFEYKTEIPAETEPVVIPQKHFIGKAEFRELKFNTYHI